MIFATAARTSRRFERTSATRRNMISRRGSKKRFSGIKKICRNKEAVSIFSLTGEIDTAVVFCEL